jgi:4-hydroxybenzoate polyprenyltransferase
LYAFAVLFWVSGFDIIYALQDEEFDKSLELHSIPVALGKKNALKLSTILHLLCGGFILFASYQLNLKYPEFGNLNWLAATIFTALLFYQHTLVKPNDLSKVNLAFFTTNGLASIIFGSLVILDLFF